VTLRRYDPRFERGQTLAEYSVILALILLAVIATVGLFSGGIVAALQSSIQVL
jgi:Flp pilus assembly pilin Flp